MASLDMVMRIVHVLSAMVVVGGASMGLLAPGPAMRLLDDYLRAKVLDELYHQCKRLMRPTVVMLFVSGIYNWWRNVEVYGRLNTESSAHWFMLLQGLLGLKVLAAVGLAMMVFRPGFGRGRRMLVGVVGLGMGIVILAAVVRWMRMASMSRLL